VTCRGRSSDRPCITRRVSVLLYGTRCSSGLTDESRGATAYCWRWSMIQTVTITSESMRYSPPIPAAHRPSGLRTPEPLEVRHIRFPRCDQPRPVLAADLILRLAIVRACLPSSELSDSRKITGYSSLPASANVQCLGRQSGCQNMRATSNPFNETMP